MKKINQEELANITAGGCGSAVVASGALFLLAGVAIIASGGAAVVAVPALVGGFLANGTAWATCRGQGWYS